MSELSAPRGPRLGPYVLGERLGSGGMAEVFIASRAGPRGFSKRFAIKRILPQLARDAHFVAMFSDEARICAALSHPNIVQVVDFGEQDGELFMAMEYVEGVSCAKLLRAVASQHTRVPLGAALYIAHEVLRALAYAHSARDEQGRPFGIVHRDVSPGNVLLGRAGEVKLTDFGIVRSEFIDRRTNPGELKGKIGYMSPEQALGSEVDARSDLFTIAIILAELVIARPLFPGRSEIEILSRIHDADLSVLDRHAAELPIELVRMLRRALARAPADRFESAEEFAETLRAVARGAHLQLSDAELCVFLFDLGIMPKGSGLRPAVGAARSRVEAPRLRSVPSDRPTERAAPSRRGRSAPSARPPAPEPRAALLRSVLSDRPTEPGIIPDSSARFRLEVPEGRAVGLLGTTDLIELVVTGRVSRDARVVEPGRAPRPIGEVAQLGRLTRQETYAFGLPPSEHAETMPLEASALPSLLYSLAARRATGLLVARDRRREKRIYLRGGAPVFVASTSREELLGRRLVAQALIRTEQLGVALTDVAESGGHLGVTLVDRGYLRPAVLVRALHSQIEARAIELGTWTRGELAFDAGQRTAHEAVPPARSPAVWVTRLVRTQLPACAIDEALASLGPVPLAANPSAPFDLDALGLDAEETLVLAAAIGTRSIAHLIDRLTLTGTAAATARRAVYVGLCSGILVAPGWSSQSPRR
jgi:serine/threonine-protein kinase